MTRRPRRPRTLRETVGIRFVLAVCVQLLLFIMVAFGVALASSHNGKLSQLETWQVHIGTVEESMLEQRAELHDYLASGNQEFEKGYLDHHQESLDSFTDLERDTSGSSHAGEVKRMGAMLKTWQGWAEAAREKGPKETKNTHAVMLRAWPI